MSRDIARAQTQFFGGRVCLDFANTLDWRTSADPQELIPDYAALLSWSERRGTLPTSSIEALRVRSLSNADAARAMVIDAHGLRADICAIADRLRAGMPARLDRINAALSALPAQPALVVQDKFYVLDLPGHDLQEPLWPILWSLTALLASNDAGRIGCCSAAGCGWFFVDESPNHSRLWCSSEVCGNRERARRAYAKRNLGMR